MLNTWFASGIFYLEEFQSQSYFSIKFILQNSFRCSSVCSPPC